MVVNKYEELLIQSTYTVLLFTEFENLIEVDSNQAVLYDVVRRCTPSEARGNTMEKIILNNVRPDF